jgi:hypothetical protein
MSGRSTPNSPNRDYLHKYHTVSVNKKNIIKLSTSDKNSHTNFLTHILHKHNRSHHDSKFITVNYNWKRLIGKYFPNIKNFELKIEIICGSDTDMTTQNNC